MTVAQKQHLLAYLGYYTGTVDGLWGPASEKATEELQAASGLEEDGDFGDATLAAAKNAVANDLFKTADEGTGATTGAFRAKHFTRQEFACPCGRCGGFPVEPQEALVRLADDVREDIGLPVILSSGVRCQAHNDELPNSVPNSRHVRGKAMDFCVPGKTAAQILAFVNGRAGVNYAYAIDGSYVHMDVE